MQTIQIEIPDELALKLLPYQHDLPSLLEAGLAVKEHTAQPTSIDGEAERVRRVLLASGRVRVPSPHTDAAPYVRHTPVAITGQAISEIVIEQRGER